MSMKCWFLRAGLMACLLLSMAAEAQTTRPGFSGLDRGGDAPLRGTIVIDYSEPFVSVGQELLELNQLLPSIMDVRERAIWPGAVRHTPTGVQVELNVTPRVEQADIDVAVQRIRDLAKGKPGPDVAGKVARIAAELRPLGDKLRIMEELAAGQEKLLPNILVDRMQRAATEMERVEMELMAKEARRRALRDQIKRSEAELEERAQTDPVLKQLRAALELQKVEMERTAQMVRQGMASQAELAAAKVKVAEAETTIEVRQESLRRPERGSLLERMTTELAMLMVDVAELEVRRAMLAERVLPLDLGRLNEQQLENLSREFAGAAHPSRLPPLYEKLSQRQRELQMELLGLIVKEVRVVP